MNFGFRNPSEESLSQKTGKVRATSVSWRGRTLNKRIDIFSSTMRFLYHVTAEQAQLLLAQRTVQELVPKQEKKITRLLLSHTPGPIFKACHPPSMRDFATAPAVIYKRNTEVLMAPGSYEFDERKFDNQDRWAFQLSVTDNLKQLGITKSA